jgi:creatinine amidohydrolase
MQLALMTWSQVEAYLANHDSIIIPTGATEQHGPNGLIGTDHLVADGIARALGERCGLIVHPVLSLGMSLHHLGFPGTSSLSSAAYERQLIEVIENLSRHGFRRFYFMNGHGGNSPPASCAFSDLLARRDDLALHWRCWWEHADVKALEDELFGEANGDHATAAEISITMHLHPGAVTPCDPLPIEKPEHEWPMSPEAFRATFPDGRMYGDPSLASEEKGKRLFNLCLELYGKELEHLTR